MKIFLATDHAAFTQKEMVKSYLSELGHEVVDLGTHTEERCDYPTYAIELARHVAKENGKGVLLCGSGIGVSIVANRFKGIRAALCRSAKEAELSRAHNDSNVLCMGGRLSSEDELKAMVRIWLDTEFEGGRHTQRIALFDSLGEEV
ncbi:ribose-5-phosphate isomerase B [Bacteriovorax sp. BSW11_IV]|uniref:ribose 5-phosphate isomerase B n=1 Tax=Bacteriovorax sp. BSW11_IV TaxID=1353529 RepID=UPI00038A14F4|nr:ribose 5-phosphate isomerase B [Bacteriovorax sp. BSW11_IV]EQC45243.1 ribose-5-phosphate isomerase B [Bacteriovorax sp. BSW11_IV]